MTKLEFEIKELIVKDILEEICSRDLIEWAVSKLEDGFTGTNLSILAGLEYSTSIYETTGWFWKTLKEMGINYNKNNEILDDYAEELIRGIGAGRIQPREGVHKLDRLFSKTNYDSRYDLKTDIHDFQTIADALMMMDIGDEHFSVLCPGLEKTNVDKFIVDQALISMATKNITIPSNIYSEVYCNKCEFKGVPIKKIERKWYEKMGFLIGYPKRPKMFISKCPNCGSTDLLAVGTVEGQKRYLKEVYGIDLIQIKFASVEDLKRHEER